jgi:hypothetical protein
MDPERAGLFFRVGEIEHARLQVAVEDPSDDLALPVDDRTP